jgi:lipopolysaccharide/colanic/teichoic acid biosynthesis glycosyltransferase
MKRMFDIVLAGAALLVLSPCLIAIAAAVKLSSPGPVFYRGVRTGKDGRPFRIFKFRSMVVDGEQLGGTTTGQNDPRVTAAGAFLRKYKLDELPQLINVLVGEMSVVGPRPEVFEYTDQYTPDERRILTVRPGITDLASLKFHDLQAVVGDDADRTYRDRVLPQKNKLRLQYVDTRSFRGDLRILWITLWTLLLRHRYRIDDGDVG